MKLSIITINRNNRAGLERTLRSSLENQSSFGDWEQIVIDGASTDGSMEVLANFRNNLRLGFFVSEPDTGIYNAMNKGARHAQGEYLMFLNSGDELLPDVLIKVFSNPFSEDIVYGEVLRPRGGKDILCKSPSPAEIVPAFFLFNSLPHQASFIRRDCLNRFGGYDESYALMGDAKFFLTAVSTTGTKLKALPFPVSRFYYDGVSSDSKYLEQHIRERESFLTPFFGKFVARCASFPSANHSFISPATVEATRNDAALACFLARMTHAVVLLWRFRLFRSVMQFLYRTGNLFKRKP